MGISKETVSYVARLARIELKPDELERLAGQLQDIVNFVDKLKNLDLKSTLPTHHILPLTNVLREDIPGESLPAAKALDNAPQKEGNFFGVPKVIE